MIKKSILLAAAILSTLSSSSSTDNYKMGFSMGIAHHDISVKKESGEKGTFIKSAPSYGLFAGVDHIIDQTPFFLGAEFSASNHSSEKEQIVACGDTSKDFTLRLKTNNSLSAALRAGVVSDGTLLYAKTGLALTNWQTTACLRSEPAEKAEKSNFNKVAFVGGFGVESKLNHNVSLGLEHDLIFTSAFKFSHNGETSTVKPMAQKTSLRLTYSF